MKGKASMKTQAEISDLKDKLDNLLDAALTDKGRIEELMAHYRVKGLYNYSLMNSMLIACQGGSVCQSYKRWQDLGRQVRKGERARIHIWRPAVVRVKKTKEDGTEDTEEKAASSRAFWLVGVFDLAQTDGKPLEYEHNSAVPERFDMSAYIAAADRLGFPLVEEPLTGPRGYTDGKRVVVSSLSNEVDKTKTLFHELGHCLLHYGEAAARNGDYKATREIEAEAVSHLCCAFFGVPFDLCQEYVSNYSSGRDSVRKSKVIKAAQTIIKAVLGQNASAGETAVATA
jgi:antirestriction protein ArdC